MGFPAAASSNMRLCSLLILQYGEMFTPLAVTATTMLLTLGMHSKCVCDEVLNLWYVLESSNFAFISCKKKNVQKPAAVWIQVSLAVCRRHLIDVSNSQFPRYSANLWWVFYRLPAPRAGWTGPTAEISTDDCGVVHTPVHWPHCHTDTSDKHATWRDTTLTGCCNCVSLHTLLEVSPPLWENTVPWPRQWNPR